MFGLRASKLRLLPELRPIAFAAETQTELVVAVVVALLLRIQSREQEAKHLFCNSLTLQH